MNIELVKSKIGRLLEVNPTGEYGYIKDALSEEELSAFESEHGIQLPPDYRLFLNKMFNGGDGPYQIMPLDFWDSSHNAFYLDSLGNKLSEPFPLTEAWEDDYSEERNYADMINGTIRLAHIGCGNFIFLVVNGPEYGNLWIDDRSSTSQIIPMEGKDGGRLGFEEWYMGWLDTEIDYHENKEHLDVEEDHNSDEWEEDWQKSTNAEPSPLNRASSKSSPLSLWKRILNWLEQHA